MTYLDSTSSNETLHVRYAELVAREQAADAQCKAIEAQRERSVVDPDLERRYRIADAAWCEACDARVDADMIWLSVSPLTLDDFVVKSRALANLATDNADDLAQFAVQLAAFAQRRPAD